MHEQTNTFVGRGGIEMQYTMFFIVMLVMVLLSGLASLAAPLLLQVWTRSEGTLDLSKVIVILGLVAAAKIISILLCVFREKFAKDFNKKNFHRMMKDYAQLSYDTILSKGYMSILERISVSVNGIYSYMTGDFIQIWSGILIALSCVLLVGLNDYVLAGLMLSILPIQYIGFAFINKKLNKLSLEMQQQTGTGFQEILTRVQNVEYIKQLSSVDHLYSGMEKAEEKVYGSMARVNTFAQSSTIALQGISDVLQIAVELFALYGFIRQTLSPYALLMITILLPLYFSSIKTIVNAKINKKDYNAAKTFEKELIADREKSGKEVITTIESVTANVDGMDIFDRHLDFHAHGIARKGDIVQICGSSGTGKSTFAKGLLHFRSLTEVKINDVDINDVNLKSLRGRIEYIPQDVPIINATLKENLLLNIPEDKYSDKELYAIEILQTIFKDKTLDTEIFANAGNLSGGEKQKIALARALLEKPDVLVLDEVCANIDAASGNDIYAYLKETKDERITFIITHDTLPKALVTQKWNA